MKIATKESLISKARFWVINILLLLTAGLLCFGLVLPLMTFKQLIFFNQTFSVLEGMKALFIQDQYGLCLLVLIFSILIPIFKLGILLLNWNFPAEHPKMRRKLLALSSVIAKWSMLDVFVVAIFIVVMKIELITKVQTHIGLFIFTTAVLGLMILTFYVNKTLARQLNESPFQ